VLVLAAALIAGCTGSRSAATELPPDANAVVAEILDGDTIDVEVGGREERVRLIGIDTPEIAHDAFDGRAANDAECYGAEAQRYTEGLLAIGSGVRLERDVVPRDDYGRLLAYVYRASDGAFVNYEIVRHGFAQPLTIAPNTHFVDLFVEAARTAEHDDVGLWAACRQE
jgi:micrococcal nuclease